MPRRFVRRRMVASLGARQPALPEGRKATRPHRGRTPLKSRKVRADAVCEHDGRATSRGPANASSRAQGVPPTDRYEGYWGFNCRTPTALSGAVAWTRARRGTRRFVPTGGVIRRTAADFAAQPLIGQTLLCRSPRVVYAAIRSPGTGAEAGAATACATRPRSVIRRIPTLWFVDRDVSVVSANPTRTRLSTTSPEKPCAT